MIKIEIKNLHYAYYATKIALRGLDLQIEQGSFVSIVGHNGSGKSTLAKALIGLVKPSEGEIYIDGVRLEDKTINQIRQKVGVVFQNPDNQFIGATVEDDIAFGLENRQIPTEEMPGIISEYASFVKMDNYLQKEPTILSGGQKQRVAIAGILALKPEILILDEATSMIDANGKKEIFEVIKNMRKENPNLTIVSITHEVEEAYLSDRVVVLEEGVVVCDGKPEEIFSNKELRERYHLSMPFIVSLKEELKEKGYDVNKLNDVEEVIDYLCR